MWNSTRIGWDTTVSLTGTATANEVIVNGWNTSLCLQAAPIAQWRITSWIMMLTNSFGLFFWALNLVFDNRGGWMHLGWLRMSEAWALSPIIAIIYAYSAWNSYGVQSAVYLSWSGNSSYTTVTPASADHKYLMWRIDPKGVNVPALTYTLLANLNSQGYDTLASTAINLVVVSSAVELILWAASL